MDIKTRQLRLVQAVAAEKTLIAAARRLRLSQAAVSQGLKELELQFNQRLFERSQGAWHATPGGRRLLAAADQVLGTLERAKHDLSLIAVGKIGVVRMATQCYTSYHWLPPVLGQLRESFPDFELRLVPEATRDSLRWLYNGDLDLVITHRAQNAPGLKSTELFSDELVAVMAPDHRLASRTFLEPEHFADEELVFHSDPSSSVITLEFLNPASVKPKRISELQLTEAVLSVVGAGMGISALAHWMVAPEVKAGNVVARRLGHKGLFRQWSAVSLANSESPAVIDALVAALQNAPLAASLPT